MHMVIRVNLLRRYRHLDIKLLVIRTYIQANDEYFQLGIDKISPRQFFFLLYVMTKMCLKAHGNTTDLRLSMFVHRYISK